MEAEPENTLLDESNLELLEEQAEQELGFRQSIVTTTTQSVLTQQRQKQSTVKQPALTSNNDNFFFSNLGRVNLKNEMKQVPISRYDPFRPLYGDIYKNMFAFMLTELDTDVDALLERLEEINSNLDREIDLLNDMIGDAGPRQSTKFAQIAQMLKSNLRARVSETMTGQSDSDDYSIQSSDDGFVFVDIMSTPNAAQSYRRSNRQSRADIGNDSGLASLGGRPSRVTGAALVDDILEEMRASQPLNGEGSGSAVDEAELMGSCDLFRQIKIETIKEDQKNISEMTLKEKQLKSHAKLEDLKIKLLRLIGDVKNTVTYNCFNGQHYQMARNSDGIPLYGSFHGDDNENDDSALIEEEQSKIKDQKQKDNEKQKLADLLQQIVYQLEKLRFIYEKCIYPRDMTLKMLDPLNQEQDSLGNSRKLGLMQLHNDRYLLLAFKILQSLNDKITKKMNSNKHSRLIEQLKSKVQIQNALYQSFNGFLAEHNQQDNENQKSTKVAILKARFGLIKQIEHKAFDQIDLSKELNQHLLRLVMNKHDSKRSDNLELMLKEEIFLKFRITEMNWGSLFVNQDVDEYYEVSLQIFYGDNKPLSNKTMIPLVHNREHPAPEGGLSWIFMQVPMEALLTRDLAMVIEVHKVVKRYGDVEPMRCFGVTKNISPIKTLEGWSIINLSASYLLSNLQAGQASVFSKLRMFDASKLDKKSRIVEKYQCITPDQIKQSASSAVLTQILSLSGSFSFEADFRKATNSLKNSQCIEVDLFRVFERGIYTKNALMQKRLTEMLTSEFNTMQLSISSIKVPNPPPNSVVNFQICLVDNSCNLIEDSWTQTRNCSGSNILSIFESETKELLAHTEFKDTKFIKLPKLSKVADYKNYYLIIIVKIGQSDYQTNTNNLFRSQVNVIEQWRTDPRIFSFKPVYLSVLSLYDPEKTMLLSDGKHQPQMLQFEYPQLMQMVQRAHEYGSQSKIQTWMFSVCPPAEVLTIETKLFSNLNSTTSVINYMLSIDKPSKLTIQNADKMLQKMRSLVADKPVELLIHYKQIFNKIFLILSQEYEFYEQGQMRLPDANKIVLDEDRQDVAFETLLIMIDLFCAIFPQYKWLFIKYLEESFYHPRVFVALTAQLTLIGRVFSQDISNANRFWLTQTLSYLPIIVKILRISFIQHQKLIEKKQKSQMKTNFKGGDKGTNQFLNSTINEDVCEHDENDGHVSACFGDESKILPTQETRPTFGAKQDQPTLEIIEEEEPNMVDLFLSQSNRQKMNETSHHKTEELKETSKASIRIDDNDSFVSSENVLLQSERSDSTNPMNKSDRSEAKQGMFETTQQKQMNQARRQVQIISSRLDKESFAQKKLARDTWRMKDVGANNRDSHFSVFLKNLPENEKLEEEDIQQNVSESVIEIFKGCHQDGLKITMFLRGILFQNFQDILTEVSLVCGATTAATLLGYLYCPFSLRQQYKFTGQIDSGISSVFKEEEEKAKKDSNHNTILSESFINELNDPDKSIDDKRLSEKQLGSGQQKITLMNDFIGSGHFPFGADIDSSTTDLSLNQLRVVAMGQILYERVLEKIPGNSNQAIEEIMIKFAHYIDFFGNMPSAQNVSENYLMLRIHVFYFLYQLIFFIYKAECVNGQADINRIRKSQNAETEALGNPSPSYRQKIKISLVQNPDNYLHKLVDIFVKSLYQYSQDVLLFMQNEGRIQRLLEKCPYIKEKMSSFIPQCQLVLLTLKSHASKPFLLKNFFNRPSILAKMLDNFNKLDESMKFEKPYNTYIDQQKLDLMAQFNQNVSELIMEQFDRGLPELYVPVVNKLFFRYYILWLDASHCEFNLQRQRQQQAESKSKQQHQTQQQSMMVSHRQLYMCNSNEVVFNKTRLLQNGMKLILKFKRKCLPDIIVFKTQQEDQQAVFGSATTAKSLAQASQVCLRRDLQQRDLTKIFARMHQFYEISQDMTGVEEVIWLLLEAARLEFELTNQVRASSSVLINMFTTINYLQMPYKEVKVYVTHVNELLDRMAKTQTNFKVNGEAFQKEFAKHIVLLEDTYTALSNFKQNKTKSNIFLRVLYGGRVIELLGKACLYYEMEKFSKNEYAPILERDFKWSTESAFLHIYRYNLLESLIEQGSVYLGEERIKVSILCNEITEIVEKLIKNRCYALALEKNEKIKMFYQKNYDLEKIQVPLQTETKIYQRMHKDQKKNYSTYFKVEFLGNAHLEEFRDKTFIMRTPYQDKWDTEEELQEQYDSDIVFVEDKWPTEDQRAKGTQKYVHLVKVMPLTLKEIDEFDMHDMVDRGEIVMDEDDNKLLEKIQTMPTKLQNFYIQNFKNKFYYQESVRIPGVDGVAFDQNIQIFTVKHKFPYIVGLQKVLTHQHKTVSSVRHAIKSIKDQDNELTIIKKAVREQAIDPTNVNELNTKLRELLVTDINGGLIRYLTNFFSEKSLSIPDRQDLLLTLYTTFEDHFANVKESIELFSYHSEDNSAFQMYFSKLSALERALQQVQQKTNAHCKLEQNEITQEFNQVADAMRYSTNVHVAQRNSDEQNETKNGSYLFISQDISSIEAPNHRTVSMRQTYANHIAEEEKDEEDFNGRGKNVLDNSQESFYNLLEDSERAKKLPHKSSFQ